MGVSRLRQRFHDGDDCEREVCQGVAQQAPWVRSTRPKAWTLPHLLVPGNRYGVHAREETKEYTKKTGITDFLSIWAEVKNTGGGKWSIGKIDKSPPDAAAKKNEQQAQDEWDRQKHAAEKAAAEEKMRKKIADEKEREAKEKAAQEMKASERIRYERERQAEQDEKDRIAKEELIRQFEESKTVTEILSDDSKFPGNPEQDKIDEINKSKKKSDALPLKYRKDLYEKLLQAFNEWEREALMRAGNNKFSQTCTTTETFMTEVYEYIDREFEDCTDEKSRIAVKNNAVK